MSKTPFERFVGEALYGGGTFDAGGYGVGDAGAEWLLPIKHNEFSVGYRALAEEPDEEETIVSADLEGKFRIKEPELTGQPLFETVTPGGNVPRKGSQPADRGAVNFSGGEVDIEPAALPPSNPNCRCYTCEARRLARAGEMKSTGNRLRWGSR